MEPDNYLIDMKCGVILGATACAGLQTSGGGAAQTMVERTQHSWSCFSQSKIGWAC